MIRSFFITLFFALLCACATDRTTTQAIPGMASASPYETGMHYLLGQNVKQDYAKARYWFEKGAQHNDPYSENELAYLYLSGKGVEQNAVTALQWYQKASQHGLASAQYNLGLMYEHGIGTPVDIVKAKALFREAAKRGFGPAKEAL